MVNAPKGQLRKRKRSKNERDTKRKHASKRSKTESDVGSSLLDNRPQKDNVQHSQTKQLAMTNSDDGLSVPKEQQRSKKEEWRRQKRQETKRYFKQVEERKKANRGTWSVAEAKGGRYLHVEPRFTHNEEYFALAKNHGLFLYSSSTSVLFRSFPVAAPDQLSSFCFSETNPWHVYVGTVLGNIICWNWEDGRSIGRWNCKAEIAVLAAVPDEHKADDVIYTLSKKQRCTIERHKLGRDSENGTLDSERLLESPKPLRLLQVLAEGKIIITAYNGGVFVGELQQPGKKSQESHVYTWFKVACIEPLTCLDARYRTDLPTQSSKRKFLKRDRAGALDLAIGGVGGSIIVFTDFLEKLKTDHSHDRKLTSELLSPRTLHWHREAVGSLKWSRDGNYIISGGRETVLIIWQLQTNRQQELPHLTSAVDNVVVSPSGSAYLIQLADNSCMVLSTSELSPIAYVAGLQSRIISELPSEAPRIQTLEELKSTFEKPWKRVIATVHPKKANEILLAGPTSQSWTEWKNKLVPAPYLQMFDISREMQIGRQALTRNHATSVNVGPEATKLAEPNVIFLEVTKDGRWMATIEEWLPPLQDVEYLAFDEQSLFEEQSRRREVFLKFWLWDEEASTWLLETRINHPHRCFERAEGGITFDLAVHPTRAQFATVGEDCVARIWKPVPRLRDGTVVRGGKGEELYTWQCKLSIELERPVPRLDDDEDESESDGESRSNSEGKKSKNKNKIKNIERKKVEIPHVARLCYSQDGSVLTICHQLPDRPSLGRYHIVNAKSGAITVSGHGLYSNLKDVCLLERYMIVLSDVLFVFDLVKCEVVYGHVISHDKLRPAMKPRILHLVADPVSSSFAVALAYSRNKKKSKSQKLDPVTDVYIFDPKDPEPVCKFEVPEVVTALLPSRSGKGYVLVDAAADIRTVNYQPPLPVSVGADGILDGGLASVENGIASNEKKAEDAADEVDLDNVLHEIEERTNGNKNGADGEGRGKKDEDSGNLLAVSEKLKLSTGLVRRDRKDEGADSHDDDEDDCYDSDSDDDDSSRFLESEYDKPVVRPEQLTAVLDVAPSHALPPVRKLMYDVVKLFSRGGREGAGK